MGVPSCSFPPRPAAGWSSPSAAGTGRGVACGGAAGVFSAALGVRPAQRRPGGGDGGTDVPSWSLPPRSAAPIGRGVDCGAAQGLGLAGASVENGGWGRLPSRDREGVAVERGADGIAWGCAVWPGKAAAHTAANGSSCSPASSAVGKGCHVASGNANRSVANRVTRIPIWCRGSMMFGVWGITPRSLRVAATFRFRPDRRRPGPV